MLYILAWGKAMAFSRNQSTWSMVGWGGACQTVSEGVFRKQSLFWPGPSWWVWQWSGSGHVMEWLLLHTLVRVFTAV